MLPRTKRLTRAEFLRTNAKKKVFHSPSFLVSVTYGDTTKAGVVVSKKVTPSAVKRNRLRRQVYAVLSELLPGVTNNALLVVVLKKGSDTRSFVEFRDELESVLSEARLFEDPHN